VIMKQFYNPSVVQEGHKYDDEGKYVQIAFDEENPIQSYNDYIETLPLTAGPNVFGMHDNANITCALNETYGMFDTIMSLQASDGGGGGDRDAVIGLAVNDAYSRLSAHGQFDVEAITMQYPTMYEESMNTVLAQECIRYNKLIGEMENSLPMLQKALKGLVTMSNELEVMGNSIALNQVPEAWEKKAYPSLKPLSAWVDELMLRIEMIKAWVEHGVPTVFWVSGFYFPQAFLTGSLQNFARKYSFGIDTIAFDFLMIDVPFEAIKEKPADGVYIRGLFLEGARWDPDIKSLNDSRPKQLFTSMCVIHMMPIKDLVAPSGGVYRCPVYKVLSRRGTLSTTGHSTNFIMWIEVPSNREDIKNFDNLADQAVWIKAGVAAFGSLRY